MQHVGPQAAVCIHLSVCGMLTPQPGRRSLLATITASQCDGGFITCGKAAGSNQH